ncbi:hypothetical protein KIPB_017341, partial [Kipferlia bialata]
VFRQEVYDGLTQEQLLAIEGESNPKKRFKKIYRTRDHRRTYNQLKQALADLETDYEYVLTSRGSREYNPLVYWAKLFM